MAGSDCTMFDVGCRGDLSMGVRSQGLLFLSSIAHCKAARFWINQGFFWVQTEIMILNRQLNKIT